MLVVQLNIRPVQKQNTYSSCAANVVLTDYIFVTLTPVEGLKNAAGCRDLQVLRYPEEKFN